MTPEEYRAAKALERVDGDTTAANIAKLLTGAEVVIVDRGWLQRSPIGPTPYVMHGFWGGREWV